MTSQTPLSAAIARIALTDPKPSPYDAMPDAAIVRKPALRDLVSVSSETIRRWEAVGHFPKRVQLGPRTVGWRLGDIRKWLATRTTQVAA